MSDDFWDSTSSGTTLDLAAFLDSGFIERVGRILELGVLVSLGLTRDGGALGVAVFDNGRRRREYFRTSVEATDWLDTAHHALSGNGLGAPDSTRPAPRKPTRGA